jgi:hypothetical protein
VLESGLLQEQDNRYVLDHPLPSLAIPTTLHASLMARLDRLATPVKELAQIGAAVGREFSYELLNVVAGLPKEKLERALRQLAESELVFLPGRDTAGGLYLQACVGPGCRLFWALTEPPRPVARSNRKRARAKILRNVQAEPETLAHHLTEAGLLGRAVEYCCWPARKRLGVRPTLKLSRTCSEESKLLAEFRRARSVIEWSWLSSSL